MACNHAHIARKAQPTTYLALYQRKLAYQQANGPCQPHGKKPNTYLGIWLRKKASESRRCLQERTGRKTDGSDQGRKVAWWSAAFEAEANERSLEEATSFLPDVLTPDIKEEGSRRGKEGSEQGRPVTWWNAAFEAEVDTVGDESVLEKTSLVPVVMDHGTKGKGREQEEEGSEEGQRVTWWNPVFSQGSDMVDDDVVGNPAPVTTPRIPYLYKHQADTSNCNKESRCMEVASCMEASAMVLERQDQDQDPVVPCQQYENLVSLPFALCGLQEEDFRKLHLQPVAGRDVDPEDDRDTRKPVLDAEFDRLAMKKKIQFWNSLGAAV